jgi:hypothetical protein
MYIKLAESMVVAYSKCKRSSVEKRTLCAVLVDSLGRAELFKLSETISESFAAEATAEATAEAAAEAAAVKMTTWLFSKVGEGAVVDVRPSAGNALWVGEHLDADVEEAEDQEEAEEGEDVDAGIEQDPGGLCPPVPSELLNDALQAGAFCATVRMFTCLPKLRHQWRHEAERNGAGAYVAPGVLEDGHDMVEDLVNEEMDNPQDTALDTGTVDVNDVAEDDLVAAAATEVAMHEPPRRRDLTAFCVRNAAELAQSEEQNGFNLRDGRHEQTEYADAKHTDMSARLDKPGWARRPKQGKGRGEGTVKFYLASIAKLFAAEGKRVKTSSTRAGCWSASRWRRT